MGLCCQQGLQESHLDLELSFLIVKSKDNISCKALVRLEKNPWELRGVNIFSSEDWMSEPRNIDYQEEKSLQMSVSCREDNPGR